MTATQCENGIYTLSELTIIDEPGKTNVKFSLKSSALESNINVIDAAFEMEETIVSSNFRYC